jgi:Holliday junction resolvase
MTRFKEHHEHERAKLLAKELEDQGYSVIFEPDPSQLPFSLMSYRPDLIATGAAGNLIVEVRTRSDSRSIERYKQIAEEVAKQIDWADPNSAPTLQLFSNPAQALQAAQHDADPDDRIVVVGSFLTVASALGSLGRT